MRNTRKEQDEIPFSRVLRLFLTFFLCFLDQFTKALAQTRLRGRSAFEVIPGILELRYLENRGIAWGMLQGKTVVFLLFSVCFFLIMIFLAFRIPKSRRYLPLQFVWILMVSGAAGNFIDRLHHGYVVDFIYLSCIHFPIFNVADICVVSGGLLLAGLILFYYQDEDFEILRSIIWKN